MQIIVNPPAGEWKKLCTRPLLDNHALEQDVRTIMEEVRAGGDEVLGRYSRQFDGVEVKDFKVSEQEMLNSEKYIDRRLKAAIIMAAENIEVFHQAQKPDEVKVTTMPGVECSMRYLPIERVGLYIPGGTAPHGGSDCSPHWQSSSPTGS